MPDRPPILVTGSHRSGTSWVGRMIAACPSPPIAYLWEPFSILHRPGLCEAGFPFWFPYICPENAAAYREPIADMLAFRYKAGAELRIARTPRDIARLIRDRARFARFRRQDAVPLMKDPIAVFSAEWLSDSFGAEVLVMIRHPAAFADSIKQRGWTHPFAHFLAQPLLMQDLLHPFEEQIRRFAVREEPPLEQGILLWSIIHHVILGFRDRRPDWMFVRLEDVSRDPSAEFEKIYARLGLTVDDGVLATISAHSSTSNPAWNPRPDDVRRDSLASSAVWRTRLTEDEIDRIRTCVEPISREFYSDEDW